MAHNPPRQDKQAKRSSFLERMFQSTDSTTEFLRNQLMRSNDSISQPTHTPQQEDSLFASNASFFTNLMNSTGGLVRNTSDAFKSTASSIAGRLPDLSGTFSSRDWKGDYAGKHDEDLQGNIDFNQVFQSRKRKQSNESTNNSNDPWMAMYEHELSGGKGASIVPAPRATSSRQHSNNDAMIMGPPKRTQHKMSQGAVEPTENDVLMGRGGRTNNHPGNKRYLEEKVRIQPHYLAATKEDKTDISQELVDIVHGWGGRFLKLDGDFWFEVDNKTARKKASQTLREMNTPEERARKRAKYNNKHRN